MKFIALHYIRRILERRIIWYVVLPVVIAGLYWFGLRSFAFSDGSGWRIPALPKVFFDQTMYLQVLAKDIVHGFQILPLPLGPFVWLAGRFWPAISLSEIYAAGAILSAVASLWLLAALIRRLGGVSVAEARERALAAFFIVQAILVLRPAGPSWYVPFFLLAFLLVWIGEGEWERKRTQTAVLAWLAAVLLASVYPWYFAAIVATCGLLFLARFMRASFVLPLIGAGLVATGAAFFLRDRIIAAVTSSYSVMLAVYGGVGWSHLTTLSNTILVIFAWCAAWLFVVRRVWASDNATVQRTTLILLAAWVAQAILWFQSVLTGLSIVPDHFIYTVWLLSAVSWAVWSEIARDRLAPQTRRLTTAFGLVAILYLGFIFARLATGYWRPASFPSLLIHIGIWTFLALAMLPARWAVGLRRTAFVLGVLYTALGALAVRASALERANVDREMDGVRQWIARENPSPRLRWCGDVWTSDYLFSTTGQAFYPSFSEKHDPVSIAALQNRLVEVATYFDPRAAGELYVWDDMILHDLEFPCRAFVPGIRLVKTLPLASSTRRFVTGCDQAWADGERARVIGLMDARHSAALPMSSALCDRFVVRKRLESAWRIPPSYEKLYEDEKAVVYGAR